MAAVRPLPLLTVHPGGLSPCCCLSLPPSWPCRLPYSNSPLDSPVTSFQSLRLPSVWPPAHCVRYFLWLVCLACGRATHERMLWPLQGADGDGRPAGG